MINPDLPEAAQLRTWFDSGGANSGVKEMSSAGGGMGQPKVSCCCCLPCSLVDAEDSFYMLACLVCGGAAMA
jgi:hypothetical protein